MAKIRRYDLDWLRVIVFGLLILYHVGMFFVPWGWHIKNNELYDWLRWPMLFVNQWRLPILFVISGMGTAFALSSRSIKEFIKERNARLGIPLLFGILFIVPPQVYIERIVNGQFAGGYLEFWPWHTFDNGVYPEGNFTWHHLWFLPYLLVFSLILSPVFGFLRKRPDAGILTCLRKWIEHYAFKLFILVIPFFLY
jgi:glucan biosynthesis protein C